MTPQPLADNLSPPDPARLAQSIKDWGRELGFQQVGISDVELGEHEAHLQRWLEAGYHGEMDYMAAHGSKRSRPAELVPGTRRVISLRMDYLPGDTRMAQVLATPEKAYVSRYALGRDYHKLIRKRLQQLAERIQAEVGPFGFRAFVDSAPVLEKAIAEQAGLGWIGKNTLVLNRKAGSYFFLGELFVDMPLPVDPAMDSEHCGRCSACLDICPTAAFVGPYRLDARRCISYLTIEYKGAIPLEAAATDRQPGIRLRRLPDRLPMESLRPPHRAGRLPAAPQPGQRRTRRTVPLERGGVPRPHRGFAAAPRRLRTLVAQPGGGAGQRALDHPGAGGAEGAPRIPFGLVREHVEWALRRHGET